MKENGKSRSELECLHRYKKEVEQQLHWGDSKDWRHQDFVALSEKIFEKTEVQLSNNTLKRLWGKIPYDSVPNTQTLNTLAQFLGYENWLAYKMAPSKDGILDPSKRPLEKILTLVWSFRKKAIILGSVLTLLSILALSFVFGKQKSQITEEVLSTITFSSRPVAKGVPNTVIFQYDVSKVPSDNILIQQTWDERKQFAVTKDKFEASSIYYYPGYWRAKLLIDGDVIREHDIYITTEGWLSIINNKPVPRYLLETEMANDGKLRVNDKLLNEILDRSQPPTTMIHSYVAEFEDVSGDDFTMEASFQNLYAKGDGICQKTSITLSCTEGVIFIPFSIPGCVGDLELFCSEVERQGKDFNFSAFGCDFSDWQHVRCEVKDTQMKLYLNKKLTYQLNYEQPLGKFAGLHFAFTGAGAIDDVILRNGEGAEIFNEDF